MYFDRTTADPTFFASTGFIGFSNSGIPVDWKQPAVPLNLKKFGHGTIVNCKRCQGPTPIGDRCEYCGGNPMLDLFE